MSRRAGPPAIALLTILCLLALAGPAWAQDGTPEAGAPACQGCHPDEYTQWQASTHANATLDPAFQKQLDQQHNQDACLECHTTGFEIGSQSVMTEGVTCEACHGAYKEGHPAANTMTLPMASETCRTCHRATFVEWEQSEHGQRNIECFDCHIAHSQGLRTGSEESLCVACHPPHETESAHVTHPINGIACSGCHMSEQMSGTHSSDIVQVTASAHGFDVASDTCVKCHSTVASDGIQAAALATESSEDAALAEQAALAGDLESRVQMLEDRLTSVRNVAVMGMGLAFGMGGFIGLAAGLVAMALLRKPKPSEEEKP
jgi:hypothetical protein